MNTLNTLMKNPRGGMELVQVAIIIAIAVVVAMVFKTQITGFVNNVFNALGTAEFKTTLDFTKP